LPFSTSLAQDSRLARQSQQFPLYILTQGLENRGTRDKHDIIVADQPVPVKPKSLPQKAPGTGSLNGFSESFFPNNHPQPQGSIASLAQPDNDQFSHEAAALIKHFLEQS